MSAFNKFLFACFLSSLVLITNRERFNLSSFFKRHTNETPAANNMLVSNAIAPKQKKIASNLPHTAVVPGSRHHIFKKNTSYPKLIKKVIAEIADCNTSAALLHTITETSEKDQPGEMEIIAVQQQNIEMEPSMPAGRKLAGTAYEEGLKITTGKLSPLTEQSNIPVFSAVKNDKGADTYSYSYLYEQAEHLKQYAVRAGNNTDYAIIVNLGLKSEKKRFFVIDLSTNTIIKMGIVAARNEEYNLNQEKQSPETGTISGTLGMYTIDKRISSGTGYAYNLLGLQEGNKPAAKSMMLQATDDTPYNETGLPVLGTNGNLSLSPGFLKEIAPMLDNSAKPMLLLIYGSSADNQPLYTAIQKK